MELLKNLNMSNSSLKNEFMTQHYIAPTWEVQIW